MGIMNKVLSQNVSLVVAVAFLTQILPFGNAAFAFPSRQPTSPPLASVSPSCQGKRPVEATGLSLARSEGWGSLNEEDSDNGKMPPGDGQKGNEELIREGRDEWKPIREEGPVVKPPTPSESTQGLIGTKGGTVEDAALGVQVSIGPGNLSESTRITISPIESSPPLMEVPLPKGVTLVQGSVFDLGPTGLVFQKPIQVTVKPSPEFRQYLKRGEEFEVGYWNGKTWQPVLDWRSDDQGTIYFETDHFTLFVTTMILIMGGGVIGITKKLDEWKNPWQYITPDSPKVIRHARLFVRNLPDPDGLSSTGRTPLKLKSFAPRGGRWFLGKPRIFVADGETMISRIDANCYGTTNYVASVLLAKKNPHFTNFICVSGSACCDDQKNRVAHAWMEIRIKGKLYIVDTTRPDNICLIPNDIAYRKQALRPGLQWNQFGGSLKAYVGWDGVPGADPMGKDGHSPEDSNGTSTGTTMDTGAKEPTDEQLQNAYEDGRSMGCSHVNAHTSVIKEDLRQSYIRYTHPKLRLRFREGYNDGAQACK